MKTREYEFEGSRYRWVALEVGNPVCRHEYRGTRNQQWYLADAPPTPATASALAALIEDMQVQVIAEWEVSCYKYRARESENDIIVESLSSDGWTRAPGATIPFRAGYEAGKAAR